MSRTLPHCVVGHLQHARGAAEPGVVDHHVDAAELVGGVEQRRDLRLVGHVADQLAHPVGTELGGQRLLGLGEPALVGVAEDDRLRALLERAAYDGGADAGAGRGGDHDDLAGEQVVARRRSRGPAARVGASSSCGALGLARQAEHPLGQDVALHLVAAAVDRVGAREQEEPLPLVEVVRRARRRSGPSAPSTSMATSPSRLCQSRPDQLEDRRRSPAGRRVLAAGDAGQAAQRGEPHDLELGLEATPAGRAARRRRSRRSCGATATRPSSSRAKSTSWARIETPRSKPSSPIATRPALAGLADDQVGVGARAGEEDLVELRAAGQLLDRADLDAVLVERAPAGTTAPGAAREPGSVRAIDEDPLARSARWTSTPSGRRSTHSSPSSTRLGLARWRGRSRRRARSSPAPRAPRRPGSWAGTAAAAPSVPNAISVGPSSSSPRWLTRAGALDAGVLLVEDHLLPQAQPAAAVLRRPADAGPAVLGEVPVPGQPLLDRLVVLAGAAEALERGEVAGQVLLQPAADLGAERLVLGGVAQVHVWYPTKQMLGLVDRRPCPRLLRAAAERFGDHPAYVEGDADAVLRRPAAAAWRRPRRRTPRPASAAATGSCSGGPTASTGRSPRSRCRTPAACWCRSTRATSGRRSPTWSARTDAALVVVHDGFLGRDQVARARRRRGRPTRS